MNSSSPRPKQHGKAKSNIPAKSPKQKTTVANNQGCGAGGTLSNFGNFGNQGLSSNITVAGNLIGNPKINIERTADGLKINGKIVPGVNPYDVIEIYWKREGGIEVNGEDKPGFEDIKNCGSTSILASISNPAYNNGSGPSQAPDKRYQKKGGNNIGLANSNNINSSNVNLNNINSSSPIEDSEDEVYMPKPYGKAKSKIPTKSPKQKPTVANVQGYGAGENFGWQYNNRNNKDVQFNNVGNSGRQFNNIGNRGTQINHQGNGGGVQCINSGNIDYSGSESSGYDTSDSMQFDGYNTGWQYNNRNNKDMQFNNFGNRGRQINRQGNGGVQYNSSGNVGYTTFTQDNVTVEMNGDALTINGIKVPEVKAKNLKQVKWRKGSLKINGKINEKFTGIPGRGTMNF
ncbi:putative mediator of RNA polymerase II transcription subunit 26 [Adelges cooleyi]|uniref:putative mediator of RNA polymerase II transcription subunit 26 n=1 Tax=Adelges cooleyi TaxID=133065 RepID=UPI00217FEB2E|nr:putative mediator of RNA polymerase II transcription subunit 26 [Adelges cooleyi]